MSVVRAHTPVEEVHDLRKGDLDSRGIAAVYAKEGHQRDLARFPLGEPAGDAGVYIAVPRRPEDQLRTGDAELEVAEDAALCRSEGAVGRGDASVREDLHGGGRGEEEG